jgi:hypothetical protein
VSSYPDGAPARATLTVHVPQNLGRIPLIGEKPAKDELLETNDSGVAVFSMRPEYGLDHGNPTLRIEADDHHGNRTQSTVPLQMRGGSDQILLHTNQAIFKAGDSIKLKVLSTRSRGAAYLDIVKNGQIILTRDLDLENGQAELTLTATPEMAGCPSPKFHPAVIQRGGLISENVSYGGFAAHKKRHRDMQRPGSTGTLLLSGFHDCFENGSKSRFRQPDRSDDEGRRVLASI